MRDFIKFIGDNNHIRISDELFEDLGRLSSLDVVWEVLNMTWYENNYEHTHEDGCSLIENAETFKTFIRRMADGFEKSGNDMVEWYKYIFRKKSMKIHERLVEYVADRYNIPMPDETERNGMDITWEIIVQAYAKELENWLPEMYTLREFYLDVVTDYELSKGCSQWYAGYLKRSIIALVDDKEI